MTIPQPRCCTLLCLALCSWSTLAPAAQNNSEQGVVQVYVCDDMQFSVEIKAQEAWIYLPEYAGPLPQVPSASGTRYEEDNIRLWSKGNVATLHYGNFSYEDCRSQPALAVWEAAKLRGVEFRAAGNEPGWVLEIQGDELSLETNYGNDHYRFDDAVVESDEATQSTRYTAGDKSHQLIVTLESKTCQDSMADHSYETTVSISLDEQQLQGCGKSLQ